MKHHPYADVFPMMTAADLKAMADDISVNGLAEPITTFEKMILDGRNRHRACEIANVTPLLVDFSGDDAGALAFVLSKNLNRQHLNESQRAMAAASLAGMKHCGNRKGDQAAQMPVDNAHLSQAEAAELLNVGRRTVREAKKVQEQGSKELKDAVNAGDVTVKAASELAELPKAEQKKLVQAGTTAMKAKASELRRAKKPSGEVTQPVPPPAAMGPSVADQTAESHKPNTMPTVDEDGIPIQEWAIEAFVAVPEFRDLIRIVKELRKRFSALADEPGGYFLQRRGHWKPLGKNEDGSERGIWRFDALENILMLLEDTLPLHTECPYARNPDSPHDDEKCVTCRGRRWTPKQQRSNTPKEIVAALFTHYGIKGAI